VTDEVLKTNELDFSYVGRGFFNSVKFFEDGGRGRKFSFKKVSSPIYYSFSNYLISPLFS